MPQMPRIDIYSIYMSIIYIETKTKTPQENKCLEMGKMTKLIWMSIELPSHWTTSTLRRQYWKLLRFLNILYWSPTLARISVALSHTQEAFMSHRKSSHASLGRNSGTTVRRHQKSTFQPLCYQLQAVTSQSYCLWTAQGPEERGPGRGKHLLSGH